MLLQGLALHTYHCYVHVAGTHLIQTSTGGYVHQICEKAYFVKHVGPVAEQVLLLENIGTSVLVGPEQLPSLHRLLLTAASTLQMDPPDLYIKQVNTCRTLR